jgi:aspartate racemase
MPAHIGIVGGSAEGAALCYRTICSEGSQLLGPHGHPEISMHTPSFAGYVACLARDDWSGVGELMLGSARKLASIGVDFLICPANTLHVALPCVLPRSPVPWLHIAEVVAADAVTRGFRRVGITGTRGLVESDVYPNVLESAGLEWVRPSPEARDQLHRIVMNELVRGVFEPASTQTILRVIDGLGEQGCDCVVLGCTEIPLVLDDANSPLPTLDSTRLLARAALRRAVLDQAQ